METRQILKAKILKGEKVNILYMRIENDMTFTKIGEEHNGKPHADLTNAFGAIAIHAALLAEFITLDKVKDINNPDHPKLKDFTISGFTIAGDDVEEGVIITGLKTLRGGKKMVFNTPLTRFNDGSDNKYDYLDELKELVNKAKDQVLKYLDGLRAPDAQLPLFEEGSETPPAVIEEKVDKRRRRSGTTIKILGPATAEEIQQAPVVDMVTENPKRKQSAKKK